jgi:hypothetical protein
MRIRLIAIAFAACAACVIDFPQSSAPAEPQHVEAIDFNALRAQAADALNALQQAHEGRIASVASAEF